MPFKPTKQPTKFNLHLQRPKEVYWILSTFFLVLLEAMIKGGEFVSVFGFKIIFLQNAEKKKNGMLDHIATPKTSGSFPSEIDHLFT